MKKSVLNKKKLTTQQTATIMFRKFIVLLTFVYCSATINFQDKEMKRQYEDYLQIFEKKAKPNSYEIFVENLARISARQCHRVVNRFTDE